MSPAKPPILNYAPKPPLPQRRWFRRGIFILSLVFLAAAAGLYAPRAWHHIQLIYWQRQCMNYSMETDVVYDHSQNNVIPHAWNRFINLYYSSGDGARGVVFLHSLKTPSGSERLVVVRALCYGSSGIEYIDATVFIPGTFSIAPNEILNKNISGQIAVSQLKPLKIFGGICDPGDPTHFTFDYEIAGKRTTVDGYLHDDNTVLLEERRSK